MKKLVFATLLGVLGFGLWLLNYLGAFKDVTIEEKDMGPYTLVYVEHVGPYFQIVPKIQLIEDWFKNNGLSCRFSFGEYLDDPKKIDEERLRSRGGCILQTATEKVLPPEFLQEVRPIRHYLTAYFEGSPSIGPQKVYPKLMAWMSEHGKTQAGAIIELYEVISDNKVHTTYLLPMQ